MRRHLISTTGPITRRLADTEFNLRYGLTFCHQILPVSRQSFWQLSLLGRKRTLKACFPQHPRFSRNSDGWTFQKDLTSIVSDGPAVARRIHKLTLEKFFRDSTTIHTPNPAFKDVIIKYALMGGTRVVFGIDEKHNAKNVLKAQSTGAHDLTLGNDFVNQFQLLKVYRSLELPYSRGMRSGGTARTTKPWNGILRVDISLDRNPKRFGSIVYLYVFGEMHSAFQSRSLPHSRRAEMLLTLDCVLQGWEYFVQRHPDCT